MGKLLLALPTRAMLRSRRMYIPKRTNLHRFMALLLHNGELLSLSSLHKVLLPRPLHLDGTDRSLKSVSLVSPLSS